MQILVPMAGSPHFFKPEDYPFPKPLIEVGGRPMIERVIENLKQIDPDPYFLFAVLQEEANRFSLEQTLKLLAGNCDVLQLKCRPQGALCTALLAIEHIDEKRPLLICNGDQVIEADLSEIVRSFLQKEVDAGVITFPSVHPRWSYARLDDQGFVMETAEKRVISRDAIAGFYFFRSGAAFVRIAMQCIKAGASVRGEFYIAPALNELILEGAKVTSYQISQGSYHSFYSPAKIQEFEENRLARQIDHIKSPVQSSGVQVVIPAAGEGVRFKKAGYERPKPFIDLFGRPMIEHVIDNATPLLADVHILLRNEHMENAPETVKRLAEKGHKLHAVEALTEGTACTILLAHRQLNEDAPLLVANSDQLVDFSVDMFVKDCLRRGLDGSILVFRDRQRNPKWSFAKINETGLVIRVAEKDPISDLATVGIYFFARAGDFVRAAVDMIARNDRVNGEFYTCPVYNYMISSGLRIGVFEVPAHCMTGLGTPEDLESYLELNAPKLS